MVIHAVYSAILCIFLGASMSTCSEAQRGAQVSAQDEQALAAQYEMLQAREWLVEKQDQELAKYEKSVDDARGSIRDATITTVQIVSLIVLEKLAQLHLLSRNVPLATSFAALLWQGWDGKALVALNACLIVGSVSTLVRALIKSSKHVQQVITYQKNIDEIESVLQLAHQQQQQLKKKTV